MRRIYRLKIIFLILFLVGLSVVSLQAQFGLKITRMESEQDVIDLVETIFLDGVNPLQYKNISFTGDPFAVGYFTGGYIFGFKRPEGIVMGSGFVEQFDQSNTCSGTQSTNTSGGSDPDLAMDAGQSINDACIIEFDFRPAGDSVKFNFIFSSEEYHEWVNTQYNDVFGFFLSGDGIEGQYTNDAINIAEVPGTHLPVSIFNVNCGNAPQGCDPNLGSGNNCEYLVDNLDTDNGGFSQFNLDAYTTAFVADNGVSSCEWYHIKLAIGDAADDLLDSGVFLEKGSFDPGNVEKETTYTHPTVDSVLYESCNNHESVVYFSIGSLRNDPYIIPFTVEGTATRGLDYDLITTHPGDTVYIEEGTLFDSIRIRTYADAEIEGLEDIQIIFNAVMCGFGAPDTAFIMIDDLPDMPDTSIVFTALCEETITLGFGDNIGGVSPYTFDWYTLNKDSETVEFTPSGQNQFIIPCVIYDTCGQQQSDTAVVIVPALVSDAGPDKSMCNVDSVQLEGSSSPGAQHFFWESAPFDPSLIGKQDSTQPWVYPSMETDYYLTVSDNCKNKDQDTVNVTLSQAVADAGEDQNICFGEISTLSANDGDGFTWEWSSVPNDPSLAGQENQREIVVFPTITTVYSVIVTNDCDYSAVDDVEIVVTALPPANAGPDDEVCFGQSIQLNASGGTSYQWSSIPNDPSLYVGGQDTLPDPVVTPPTQEPYKYFVQVWEQCTNNDTMVMLVNPVPSLDVDSDNDIICFGDQVTITAIGDAEYTWTANPNDPTLAGQENNQTITVSPIVSTTYTLTGVVSGFDCPAEVVKAIEVKPELFAYFDTQSDETCEGETFSVLYTGNAASDATYTWDFDGGQIVAGSGQGPIDIQWDTEGIKTIKLEVEEDGCRSEEQIKTVSVIRTPVSAFDANIYEGCVPFAVEFTNSSSNTTGNVTYNWTFGTGDESTDVAPSFTYNTPGSYDVSLTVSNESRCSTTETKTAFVQAYETPEADFELFPPETVLEQATIEFTDGSNSGDPITYLWDFDDGNTSDKQNPTHTYGATGSYMVKLLITTSNGCESEMQKEVIVHPDFAVYAPSAFTPNGDGLNDVFEVKGIGIKQYLMQVFSRWGEMIYESNNLENHWDGKFNGEFVSPGTYVYTVNYKSMLDKDYTLKGTVTVMK